MTNKKDKKIDYASLCLGATLSEQTCVMDEELVGHYRAAVQDDSDTMRDAEGTSLVPPMAVAAISLQGAITELHIPGGTLHVGHEINIIQTVKYGDTITCKANISSNNVRGDWRFLGIEHTSTNSLGSHVMTSKSTIMLPLEDTRGAK